MENIFQFPDTVTLIEAVDNFKTPGNYLTNTFFSQKVPPMNTEMIACEYRKGKRLTAPYIVTGAKGKDVGRSQGYAKMFKAPMVAPRRVLSAFDVQRRMFGEVPIISTVSPQERAASILAKDLQEMIAMVENTKNSMAAKILQGEPITIEGYADDGTLIQESVIDFGFDNFKNPTTAWDNANAKIIEDLQDGIEKIAEATGALPTMLLCGKNIERYLLKNTELKDWAKNLRENWNMMSIQPRYAAPQARYIGTLGMLGLEVYSYFETYSDSDGTVKPFIDDDTAILITPDMGKQANGVVTLVNKQTGFESYSAEFVPKYIFDEENNIVSLTVYSRFILIPNDIESWCVIKAK